MAARAGSTAIEAALQAAKDWWLNGGRDWEGRAERLAEAQRILQGLKQELFGDKPARFDLERWLERIDKLSADETVEFRDPDFASAE